MRSFVFIAAGAVAFLSTPGSAGPYCPNDDEVLYEPTSDEPYCVKCVGGSAPDEDFFTCECLDGFTAQRFGNFERGSGNFVGCLANQNQTFCPDQKFNLTTAATCECDGGADKIPAEDVPYNIEPNEDLTFECVQDFFPPECDDNEISLDIGCRECDKRAGFVPNEDKTECVCKEGYAQVGKECKKCIGEATVDEAGTGCTCPPELIPTPIGDAIGCQTPDVPTPECKEGEIPNPEKEGECCVKDRKDDNACCSKVLLRRYCQNKGMFPDSKTCGCKECPDEDIMKMRCKKLGRKNKKKFFNKAKCKCQAKCPLNQKKCGKEEFDKDNCECVEEK